jgi:hypothetical protein
MVKERGNPDVDPKNWFTIFSLVFVLGGFYFLTLVALNIRDAGFIGAIGWSFPTLFFLVPGVLGLRNVLRF